jgi:outer membrane protein
MKNISLILNAVLLVLVAYLYFVHFSNSKPAPTVIAPVEMGHSIKIAYVDSDTLTTKYEWLNQQKKALEQRLTNAQNTMKAKETALAKEMQAFNQKAQSGNFPEAELRVEYEDLAKREQALVQESMTLTERLDDEKAKTQKELLSNVQAQLKSLQSQIGYDYILSYSKGGGQVLLANDSLDITKQVLELLNAKKQ